MAEQFAIVPASSSVTLDASRTATVSFMVFNASGQPLSGQALLVPIGGPGQPWLTLYGEPQQTFAVAGAQQYAVQVTIPPTAPAGIYSFRLDMIDTARPGEGYVMGPAVTVIAPESSQTRAKNDSSVMNALPRWLAAFGAALVVVALGTYFIWRGAENKRTTMATSATAEVIAATVQAAHLETAVVQTIVAQGGEPVQVDPSGGAAAAATATAEAQAATPTQASEVALPTATEAEAAIEPTEAPPTTEPSPTTAPPTGEPSATVAPTYTLAPTQTPLPTYTVAPSNTPEPTPTETEPPTLTTVPSNTPLPTRTPTATQTTAPLGYRMSDFIGVWENIDADTPSMTKLVIAKVNDSVVSLNGFGQCSPTDCDWGVVNTAFTPYQIVVTQDVGFKMRIISVERSGTNLKAEIFNDYPPSDPREDSTYYCTMKRNLSVLPLGPQVPGLNKTLVFKP